MRTLSRRSLCPANRASQSSSSGSPQANGWSLRASGLNGRAMSILTTAFRTPEREFRPLYGAPATREGGCHAIPRLRRRTRPAPSFGEAARRCADHQQDSAPGGRTRPGAAPFASRPRWRPPLAMSSPLRSGLLCRPPEPRRTR
ncbi:Uncharacterised protein [Mycobacteroides abscessus]|nr:Uncharacterised protein [Mycobacteroides abscessus]